jgi:drug/metabolite transporter (DMT)-like permease
MNKSEMTDRKNEGLSIANAIFLSLSIAVYSSADFFSKLASGYDFLSVPYIGCLGGVIIVLGIYAVLWQMALKRVPLNQAYLFRSLGVVFGLAIAYLAFHESISWQNLLGASIVLCGLLILLSEK